ncbi:helix-turn-helix domain-containing protein [Actinophytocola sp.]|uniref:helix-turn-helix domain-containing protein n=1 Tax=Actinophytocola sp. TaxID=1872138 RepID=UPI0025BBC409|nr:helix-turn-helix domain-containing protein [Actinophytocola sp.]
MLRATVIAWCESGSHLVRTARAPHVHRNAVIYRLDRISRLTGRDIRAHRYAIALYVACLAEPVDRSS